MEFSGETFRKIRKLFNFLMHTIHTSLYMYLPSDFRVAYAANISEQENQL